MPPVRASGEDAEDADGAGAAGHGLGRRELRAAVTTTLRGQALLYVDSGAGSPAFKPPAPLAELSNRLPVDLGAGSRAFKPPAPLRGQALLPVELGAGGRAFLRR